MYTWIVRFLVERNLCMSYDLMIDEDSNYEEHLLEMPKAYDMTLDYDA